ncbi:MAG: protein kinase [Kofleriaceae bacterium]
MVRPAGQHSLAGFTLGEVVGNHVYGDTYRASGEGRRDARLLVVKPALAADARFNDALGAGTAPLLGAFQHRAVVGTIVVARDGKDLVIVTEAVAGGRILDDVLAAAPGRSLAPRVVAAIVRSVIDGVATAHAVGITHGAIHPRSIVVDGEGAVRLTDFAVGYAAMAAAAAGSDAMSLRGLGGYLAPELALGDPPSQVGDVYALGALVFALLSGTSPPGTLNTTPAMERLVQRALDTDLHRRFANAIELQENFTEALEDDRWECATPAEVARALAELAPTPSDPGDADGDIEDLLASLPVAVELAHPAPGDATLPPPVSAPPAAAPITRRPGRGTGALDALLDDLDEGTDGGLTRVDDRPGQTARDPISELIELAPGPELEPPAPRRGPVLPAPDPTGETMAAPPDPSGETVLPAPPPAPAAPPPVARPVARPVVELPDVVEPPSLRGSRTKVLSVLAVAVLVIGGYVLFTGMRKQGRELDAGKAAAEQRRAEKEEANRALEARLRAAKAKPGTIRVTSSPDRAAVWLLLGLAPVTSIALGTNNVWELRVELEGYQAQDVHVVGSRWTGPKDALTGKLEVTLTPTATPTPLPALPPALAASETPGPDDGRGQLEVVTQPPGAAVYLLVGYTNSMNLAGIEAGRDYEFKLTRDGSLPGFVRVAAEEWRAGGEPNLPLAAAPLRDVIERAVELVPAPAGRKGR